MFSIWYKLYEGHQNRRVKENHSGSHKTGPDPTGSRSAALLQSWAYLHTVQSTQQCTCCMNTEIKIETQEDFPVWINSVGAADQSCIIHGELNNFVTNTTGRNSVTSKMTVKLFCHNKYNRPQFFIYQKLHHNYFVIQTTSLCYIKNDRKAILSQQIQHATICYITNDI